MIQVSLDSEPPPRILREKETSKKKDKTLNQLVISLKSKISSNDLKNKKTEKLEDKIKTNSQNISSTQDYSSLESYFSEETINHSQKDIRFVKRSSSNGDLNKEDVNYIKTNEEDKENSSFYLKNTEYNFISSQTFIKYNNKKENNYSESKEQEKKEIIYNLRPFEEDKQSEEIVIEWNVKVYN